MECRIRHAIFGETKPTDNFEVDMNEAYTAMGNVMGELLAHAPTKTAKRFADFLLDRRKDWLKHPRVRTQHTEGNA